MQNQITLPPLIIRPDLELPYPSGPIRDLVNPIPWNGTIIKNAAIEDFFKKEKPRYLAQRINRSILIVKWLINEKRKKLKTHLFLLLKYPGRDFKKADLKKFS